jgi:hypothetical protein
MQSLSVLLLFDEVVLPMYIKLGYVRFAVRPYVQKPLQCYNCKKKKLDPWQVFVEGINV